MVKSDYFYESIFSQRCVCFRKLYLSTCGTICKVNGLIVLWYRHTVQIIGWNSTGSRGLIPIRLDCVSYFGDILITALQIDNRQDGSGYSHEHRFFFFFNFIWQNKAECSTVFITCVRCAGHSCLYRDMNYLQQYFCPCQVISCFKSLYCQLGIDFF